MNNKKAFALFFKVNYLVHDPETKREIASTGAGFFDSYGQAIDVFTEKCVKTFSPITPDEEGIVYFGHYVSCVEITDEQALHLVALNSATDCPLFFDYQVE